MATAKKKPATRAKVQAKPQAKIQPKAKSATAANAGWSQSSAKLYPFAQINSQSAEQVTQASQAATKQMQDAAEQMMKYSSDFMQQMFSGTANPSALNGSFQPAAKSTREAADQLSRGAANATKSMNDAVELGRENSEALVECSNIAASVSKQMSAEITNYLNKTFTQNNELSKQLLACRTLNDMFDLQNKFIKANLDAFFTESVKLSEMLFQCMSDVSEPLNGRVTETTERLSKAFAA